MPTLTPITLPFGLGTNTQTATVTATVITLVPTLATRATYQPDDPLVPTPNPTATARTDFLALVAGLPEDYRQVDLLTTCIAVAAGIALFFVIIALVVYLNRLRRQW